MLNCFCLFVCYEDGSENFQTFYMLNQKLEFSNIWDLMCYEMFMLSYFVNEIIISLRFLAIKIVAVKDTHYTLKKPPHFFFPPEFFFIIYFIRPLLSTISDPLGTFVFYSSNVSEPS